jgi:hypothetical protein
MNCLKTLKFGAGAVALAVTTAAAILIENPNGIQLAARGQFPWHVQVNGTDKCGGISIARDWVLTAAHCINVRKAEMKLRTGSRKLNEGVESVATHVILHDSFPHHWDPAEPNPDGLLPLDFDIALVHFVTPADPGVPSPIDRANVSQGTVHTDAFVSGWICESDVIGKPYPWFRFAGECGHMLAYTDVRPTMKPLAKGFCANRDRFICAFGPLGKRAGFSVGDSGGGLTTGTVNGAKVIGMAIFDHDQADVYLRLSSYEKWITDCTVIPPVTSPLPTTPPNSPTKYFKCKQKG